MKDSRGKKLLNVKETAEYLNMSAATIYNGISKRAKRPFPIKPVRIHGKVLFAIRDLEAFIEASGGLIGED